MAFFRRLCYNQYSFRQKKTQNQRKTKMQYIAHYQSPLGMITLAVDGENLTGIWFEDQKYVPCASAEPLKHPDLPVFVRTIQWLDIYFSGKEPAFRPPFSVNGSDFRRAVWEILLTIPFGQTMTYGEIAKKIAAQTGIPKMSAQAVGGAVGHNPISLIIPCHRVVGANGSLTGYGGGIDRKARLLALEHADMTKFFIPKSGTAL